MENTRKFVTDRLDRMLTANWWSAASSLMHADPVTLPILIEAFNDPQYHEIRLRILNCIWEQRNPEAINFLASVMNDPEDDVWKEALDGLVTISGNRALNALQSARQKVEANSKNPAAKLEWIDEALKQIAESIKESNPSQD